MGRIATGIFALGSLVLGCGDSRSDDEEDRRLEGAPLDCAWLTSDNCWKTTVAVAAACVPGEEESGMLAADRRSCSYSSGASVAFDEPLAQTIGDDHLWRFTQSQGGTPCVRFEEDEDSLALTVGGLTFQQRLVGLSQQVTCPDGSQYATDNALELLECPTFFSDAPGYAYSVTADYAYFALANGLAGDEVPVFDCRPP